jgi:hypothetical protein
MRLPPRIKVLEALGAIADGRVKILEENDKIKAEVVSSTGERKYDVCVNLTEKRAFSTDNGTRFRHYVGYPIIAVLMMKGVLPFNRELAESLKGIPWKELNEKYKKYSKVMELIFEKLEKEGIRREDVERYIDDVISKLKELSLRKGC